MIDEDKSFFFLLILDYLERSSIVLMKNIRVNFKKKNSRLKVFQN